jgi:hypothetical protein
MTKEVKHKVAKFKESVKDAQAKDAQKAFMEELFNDYYLNRGAVYKMNFVRGLFFGLGSVLGGTVVISLLVWILSFFVDFFVLGEFFQDIQRLLERTQ